MGAIDRERWAVLGPLLDHALELSDDARPEWLAELNARSPDLAAEITKLLAGEAVADRHGFLTDPLAVNVEGVQVGGYTLERQIGEGGMGSVWLAHRTNDPAQKVAVKLLDRAQLNPIREERFRREGAMLARLTHPGIAKLLDAGVTRGGHPYLVLEYVNGERIDTFANERALSVEARIELVLQVLGAIAHAHASSIVHRDLKPSNILVTPNGVVKVLDFGIAKVLGDSGRGERTWLTEKGGSAFTPEFAAPEQIRALPITAATDLYAVGVLLYVLLGGRHPTAHGCRNAGETMRALLDVQPAPLGLGRLDGVLARALHKLPNGRHVSAEAFAADLERYLEEREDSAGGSSPSKLC